MVTLNPFEVVPSYPSAEAELQLDLSSWPGFPTQQLPGVVVVTPAGDSSAMVVVAVIGGVVVLGGLAAFLASRKPTRRGLR